MDNRQTQDSVTTFLIKLLHGSSHLSPREEVKRYVSSFAQDLVDAVSRGKFMTVKHILLGSGLHSLTGQKLPIKLLARYGNACTYKNGTENIDSTSRACPKYETSQFSFGFGTCITNKFRPHFLLVEQL